MQAHPAIAALRSSEPSRRRSVFETAEAMQAGRERWLETDHVRAIRKQLDRYGAGEPLASCRELTDLLTHHAVAASFVSRLCRSTLGSLARHPMGEAPFPFRTSPGFTTLQALRSGRAILNLAAYEPVEKTDMSLTALFADRETLEIVVEGTAIGSFHRRDARGDLETQEVEWRTGDTLSMRALTETRQVHRVNRSLVTLQLTREAERPRPTCEVDLDTGAVIRRASGDKSASEAIMALGVLQALEAKSALEVMRDTALNPAEDPDVRWEAVRQVLGLGPRRGLDLLQTLRVRDDDPLSAPAEALRDQLFLSQPELYALAKESN